MVSAPMLHFIERLMLGSNVSAAKRGLSLSARCRPNRLQAVYWKSSSFLRNAAGNCARPIRFSKVWCTSSVEATNCLARTVRPSASAMPVARAVLDHDAVDVDLRLEGAAGGDEGLHQAARQIERAALAELVAALQIEGADHRAHRPGLRHRVDQPGAEQRHLEQEQQPHVLVLEQLAHHIERLAVRHLEEFAAERRARQQRLALLLRQRLGVALGQENLRA